VYGLEQIMVRLPVLCRGESEDWSDGRIAQKGPEHQPLLPHYSVLKGKQNAKPWTPIWR